MAATVRVGVRMGVGVRIKIRIRVKIRWRKVDAVFYMANSVSFEGIFSLFPGLRESAPGYRAGTAAGQGRRLRPAGDGGAIGALFLCCLNFKIWR